MLEQQPTDSLTALQDRVGKLEEVLDCFLLAISDPDLQAISKKQLPFALLPHLRLTPNRMNLLRERIQWLSPKEMPLPPWKHLVQRIYSWRKQPYIQGRNLTVRQLVGTIKANHLTPEEAAEDQDLPIDAIREALEFAEKYPHLSQSDAEFEKHLLTQLLENRGFWFSTSERSQPLAGG
jgi:uncharacterized protein (DUF433 family)